MDPLPDYLQRRSARQSNTKESSQLMLKILEETQYLRDEATMRALIIKRCLQSRTFAIQTAGSPDGSDALLGADTAGCEVCFGFSEVDKKVFLTALARTQMLNFAAGARGALLKILELLHDVVRGPRVGGSASKMREANVIREHGTVRSMLWFDGDIEHQTMSILTPT